MNTATYKFSDLTTAELEGFTDEEYCYADEVEKEIDQLIEERDDYEGDLDEAKEKIAELESKEVDEQKVFAFAIWCDKNNISVSKIPQNEIEFAYERFKNETMNIYT